LKTTVVLVSNQFQLIICVNFPGCFLVDKNVEKIYKILYQRGVLLGKKKRGTLYNKWSNL